MSEKQMASLIPQEVPESEHGYMALSEFPSNRALAGREPTEKQLEAFRRYGIRFPIQLQQRGSNLSVKDGRRRLKGARICHAEWKEENPDAPDEQSPYWKIPYDLLKLKGYEGDALTAVLNATSVDNPATDVAVIEKMMKEGYDVFAIAEATCLEVNQVKERAKYTDLVPPLRKLFDQGRISPTVAKSASRLTEDKQEVLWEIYQEKGRITGRDVADQRRATRAGAAAELDPRVFEGPTDVEGEPEEKEERARLEPAAQKVTELAIQARRLLVDIDVALGDGSPAYDEFREPVFQLQRQIRDLTGDGQYRGGY